MSPSIDAPLRIARNRAARGGIVLIVLIVLGVAAKATARQDASPRTACTACTPDWSQWGRNPRHTGASSAIGQPLTAILSDFVYDPFAPQEIAEGEGALLVHYPVPLIDGNDVYMELKSGAYTPCDPPAGGAPFPCGQDARNAEIWNVEKLSWRNGTLVPQWTFPSDWKPEPVEPGLDFEPVFHPVLAGGFLYVPGLGGTVHRVSKATGLAVARINPFADVDPARYVAGGLGADDGGRVLYNAIQLDPSNPWGTDVVGAWLVRIAPDDSTARTNFASLVSGAPAAADLCQGQFSAADRPWPPSPTAVPPSSSCGSQRPAINVVPAVAPDGTIYTISRTHLNVRYGYVVAVHPDLTPAWSASLRGILDDGCGVTVPIDDTLTGCRTGTTAGVDPQTNDLPAGLVLDRLTSSPVVLPDGAVLYAPKTGYNGGSGHLFKFGPDGSVLATFDAGFDLTPAVFEHDGTYSIKVKHNFFGPGGFEQYYLVSVDPDLVPEWTFINRNTQSCVRQPDGTVACLDDHPEPYEWCVNQPAVDAAGVTYANSDDGFLYAIDRAGQLHGAIFLDVTLGAAYAPVSIGNDGRIYVQNSGHLLAVGFGPSPRGGPMTAGASRPATRTPGRP